MAANRDERKGGRLRMPGKGATDGQNAGRLEKSRRSREHQSATEGPTVGTLSGRKPVILAARAEVSHIITREIPEGAQRIMIKTL